MTDERVTEARKALSRYEDRNSRPNPAHLADAVRGLLAIIDEVHTPTDDEREALRIAELDARQAAYRREREDWFVDHEAEPEIATNAFFRGWDAAADGGFRHAEEPETAPELFPGTLDALDSLTIRKEEV